MSSLQKELMEKKLPPRLDTSSSHPSSSSVLRRKLPLNKSFTPLPWQEFFDEKRSLILGEDNFNVYLKGSSGPIFYFLHGGGYSGLTWACLTSELMSRLNCRVVAPDLRGHGETECIDNNDVSTDQQCKDIELIFSSLFPSQSSSSVIVVGHSMGGALAVNVVKRKLIKTATVAGLVVIDVVEGTAMEALGMMTSFLSSRPSHFESEEDAVKWCLQSATVHNSRSARVSMPAQVHLREDGKYHWRIDLRRTEPHWVGWFSGLSASFLACPEAKMLVLAGTDRIDRELMIGQMQGKFQTTVLPRVGHAVQEDSPDRLADELARFAVRHKLAEAKGDFEYSAPVI